MFFNLQKPSKLLTVNIFFLQIYDFPESPINCKHTNKNVTLYNHTFLRHIFFFCLFSYIFLFIMKPFLLYLLTIQCPVLKCICLTKYSHIINHHQPVLNSMPSKLSRSLSYAAVVLRWCNIALFLRVVSLKSRTLSVYLQSDFKTYEKLFFKVMPQRHCTYT